MKCPNCGYVHSNGNGRSEDAKQKKDRLRALAAIAALERVISNPEASLRSFVEWYPLKSNVALMVDACKDEWVRLTARLDNPEELAVIYRRNEKR